MKRHAVIHSENPPPKHYCYRCDRPLKNEKTLRQHEDRCEGRKKRTCEECGKDVFNSSDVRNHLEKHRRDAEKADNTE